MSVKNIFPTASGDEVLDFTDGSYSGIVIQDNVFKNNYRQIRFEGGTTSAIVIQRNMMDGTTSEEAIRLIGANDVRVVNNVIMNSMQQGIYIDTGSSNIDVLHNSFFNNDQEGLNQGELRTKVLTADIVIKNNIFYANGSNDIFETSASSLLSEDFNLVFNSPQIGSFTFGASTITGDPKFMNTTADMEDLSLQSNSPAIDAATDLGVTDSVC